MRADAAPDLGAAQAHCRAVTLRSGSSFAAAFWMFTKPERQAVHAIYAFCRFADDVADDPQVVGSRARLLERWRAELGAAYGRRCTRSGSPWRRVRRFDLRARSSSCCSAWDRLGARADGGLRRRHRTASRRVDRRDPAGPPARVPGPRARYAGDGHRGAAHNILRDVGEDAAAGSSRARGHAPLRREPGRCARIRRPTAARAAGCCRASAHHYERPPPAPSDRRAARCRHDGRIYRACSGAPAPPLPASRPRRALGTAAARDHASVWLEERAERDRSAGSHSRSAERGIGTTATRCSRRAPAPRRAAGALDRRDRPRQAARPAPRAPSDPG
jgi:hypothetical protein